MSEWKETTLGDVLQPKGYIRGPFGSSLKRGEMKETGIPVYEQKNAIYNEREFRFFIDEEKFQELKRFQVKTNDLIISCSGTVGKISIIKEQDPKGIISQALLILRPDVTKIHLKHLFYFLSSKQGFELITQASHGSVQINIAERKVVENIPIFLPPLPEQTAIATVLSSLDDKIDLLHRQNSTLEKMAETLFRQWFVEEVKEEWVNCILEDLCSQINSGGTPSTKVDSFYNGNINWYSTKELNDNYLFESISKITQDGLDNSSAKLFPKGTVLIAIYAAPTVGRLGILGNQAAFNQAACGLIADDNICCKEFIYLYLKNQRNELNAMASGSAQQNLNVGKIKTYPAFIPDDVTLNKFKNEVIPLFDKIEKNSIQIRTLSTLRNTLLPKLMNGEVSVDIK